MNIQAATKIEYCTTFRRIKRRREKKGVLTIAVVLFTNVNRNNCEKMSNDVQDIQQYMYTLVPKYWHLALKYIERIKSFLLSVDFKQHSCMYLVFSDWPKDSCRKLYWTSASNTCIFQNCVILQWSLFQCWIRFSRKNNSVQSGRLKNGMCHSQFKVKRSKFTDNRLPKFSHVSTCL